VERYFDIATDRRGNSISGAIVTIKTPAGANATIYSDNGVTTTSNPITTDADGKYTFFAKNGKYTIQIVAEGYGSVTKDNIVLYDPIDAQMNVNDITTTVYTLSASDIGQWLDFNNSTTAVVTLTTANTYAVGDTTILKQKGAGQVQVAVGTNVAVVTSRFAKTRVQQSVIALTRINNDASGTALYSVYGDMATS
jgi:hypothetical protein